MCQHKKINKNEMVIQVGFVQATDVGGGRRENYWAKKEP